MKTTLKLPALILGAFILSTSAIAAQYHPVRNQPTDLVNGVVGATGQVINGVGNLAFGIVGGVVQGTTYLVNGTVNTTKQVLHVR